MEKINQVSPENQMERYLDNKTKLFIQMLENQLEQGQSLSGIEGHLKAAFKVGFRSCMQAVIDKEISFADPKAKV